jgi:hypothetical protein
MGKRIQDTAAVEFEPCQAGGKVLNTENMIKEGVKIMPVQDRRRQRQLISGRRTLIERRTNLDDYNGLERRTGGDRRTIIDRRRNY